MKNGKSYLSCRRFDCSNVWRQHKSRGLGAVSRLASAGAYSSDQQSDRGRSSKTFVEEGRLQAILDVIEPDDWLFVQMGHNDASKNKPERYTEPYTTYKQYLKQYIAGAREKGAHPLLITPVARFHYENGVFLNDFPDYCIAMKQTAEEENVQLIDLMEKSLAFLLRRARKKCTPIL